MTATAEATPVLMPSGACAYTVETADQVARLPYFYLCALSDQTGFVYPHRATDIWFAGPVTVLGLRKGGRA